MVAHRLAREITERYPLAQLAERVDAYTSGGANTREDSWFAYAPGADVGAQGVRASRGASGISDEQLMMLQDNTLPSRPGVQGPGS